MNKDTLAEKIKVLVKPIADELNYELYHVEYIKENGEFYLRIYIDKPEGISLTDCETLSRRVSDMLDVEDPIQDAYYLEVSSPGLNRELYTDDHLKKSVGKEVLISLTSAINGKKSIKGVLKEIDEESITILSEEELAIPRNKIKHANIDGEI
ncbi:MULTISPECIES: ribosome maturation factor RimP [Clostridium]|uniref:Ribosome maturation factor RimP n=1 Tax=Clostridium cibarium TaxID=2762247 RepID=A0ABR8PQP4_9CLOT|nr:MULTISPECIES: ribosome maturation factor RimP [Clostridium]MBD7910450.1 ribosome maturation factor RimP [Clostridium cibarium]